MESKLEIHFGALCPSLKKQLRAQKIKFDKNIHDFEEDVEAYLTLNLREYLSDHESAKVRERIMKKLNRYLKKFNR